MLTQTARSLDVLILDFDGTISVADMGDTICDRYAASTWREVDEAWERGELSLFEAQEQVWGTISAPGDDVLAYAVDVGRLRPGLDELLARANGANMPVIIASGGFDFYIRAMLGPYLTRFEHVLSNTATIEPRGLRLGFPHRREWGCERCAVCKGRVCEHFRTPGGRVTFVGDGSSDRCAIGRADRIFAVRGSKLARYCREADLIPVEFDDFHEVAAQL